MKMYLKTVIKEDQLILKYRFWPQIISVLLFGTLFLFSLKGLLLDLYTFNFYHLFSVVLLFFLLHYSFIKKPYECIINPSTQIILIKSRNLFAFNEKEYHFSDIVELQISKAYNNDDDNRPSYNLYIIFNQENFLVSSDYSEKAAVELAHTILQLIDRPNSMVSDPYVVYSGNSQGITSKEKPILFSRHGNHLQNTSGALLDKKVNLERSDKYLILTIKKSWVSKLAFGIVVFFFIFLWNDALVLETIELNRMDTNEISCGVKLNFLGNENYEMKKLTLTHFMGARIDTDDDQDTTFVIIYDDNLEFKTTHFNKEDLTLIKAYMEDKETRNLIIKENIKPLKLLWLPIFFSLICVFIFETYIAKITISKSNKNVILEYKNFIRKREEVYPLTIIQNIHCVLRDEKDCLTLSLLNKTIELGVMSNKENINELKEFLNFY